MLKGIGRILIDIFNLSYKVIYGYARQALAAIIVIICAQILCRNILRTNIRWNQEVTPLLTIWIVFLSIAVGTEGNLHIDVELLYDKFLVEIRNVVDVLNRIITLPVGAFLTVYGVRVVLFIMDSRLPAIKWLSSLTYIMIPASGTATIYFTILDIMDLEEYKKTDDADKFNKEGEERK